MSKIIIKLFIALLDIGAFYGALVLALLIRNGSLTEVHLATHFYNFSFLLPFYLGIIRFLDLYKFNYSHKGIALFFKTTNSIVYYTLFAILVFYLIPFFQITPKTLLLLQSLLLACWLFFNRKIAQHIISLFGIRFIVGLIGSIALLKQFTDALPQSSLSYSVKEVSFSQKNNLRNFDVIVYDHKKIGVIAQLEAIALNHPHSLLADYEFTEQYLRKLDIINAPDSVILHQLIIKKPVYEFSKRLFDIIAGILALIALGICLPFIAILRRYSDRGPLFFVQERVTFRGRLFRIYKLRTMIQNAQQHGPMTTEENDHRVTKMGRILRALHIDELPQGLNLIKGELSLIGPRPEQPSIVREYEHKIPFYQFRHSIPCGIIGWAQINSGYAKNLTDTIEKTKYDLYYVKHRSWLLDIEIILKTIIAITTKQ